MIAILKDCWHTRESSTPRRSVVIPQAQIAGVRPISPQRVVGTALAIGFGMSVEVKMVGLTHGS